MTGRYVFVACYSFQTLESFEITMLSFSGLEIPGKGIGPEKPWKSPGFVK